MFSLSRFSLHAVCSLFRSEVALVLRLPHCNPFSCIDLTTNILPRCDHLSDKYTRSNASVGYINGVHHSHYLKRLHHKAENRTAAPCCSHVKEMECSKLSHSSMRTASLLRPFNHFPLLTAWPILMLLSGLIALNVPTVW